MDAELSPLVWRSLSLSVGGDGDGDGAAELRVYYAATTNRMLRVAVNSFFESLRVVVAVMRDLDTDVLAAPGWQSLDGVQGIEA